jgi:hypothetical protein
VNKPGQKHVITTTALVAAPPARVYSIIADYREGHPNILPREFSEMKVEQGGVGAGTVIRFKLRVFWWKQTFRAAITEPQPGRILVETDLDANGAITTFIVEPDATSERTKVTITTELSVRRGLAGSVERYLSTRLLRPIYVRELALLASHATASRATADGRG